MHRRTLSAATLAAPALAQAQPSRPMRILVGFPPGAVPDTTARLLAPGIGQRLGETVVVENRPGAVSAIAAQALLQAPADGRTLLLLPSPLLGIRQMVRNPGFDPADLTLLAAALSAPMVLCVPPSLGVRDLAGFVALAKREGDALAYGTTGVGGAQSLAMGLLAEAAGLSNTRVTFRGESEIVGALLGGALQSAFLFIGAAGSLAADGRVVALGASSLERVPQIPAIPTLAEQGFPAASFTTWWGVAAARATPPAIQARLAEAIAAARAEPQVQARIAALGGSPLPLEGAAAEAFATREAATLTALMQRLGVTPE